MKLEMGHVDIKYFRDDEGLWIAESDYPKPLAEWGKTKDDAIKFLLSKMLRELDFQQKRDAHEQRNR